jgi:hypothetical protein
MQWEEGSCEQHGDRLIIECQVCGKEFCGLCQPGRRVCPECAEDDEDDAEALGFDDDDMTLD